MFFKSKPDPTLLALLEQNTHLIQQLAQVTQQSLQTSEKMAEVLNQWLQGFNSPRAPKARPRTDEDEARILEERDNQRKSALRDLTSLLNG